MPARGCASPALASWSRQPAPTEPPGPQLIFVGRADDACGSIFRLLFLFILLANLFSRERSDDPDPITEVLVVSYVIAALCSGGVALAVWGISYWRFPARRVLSRYERASLADAQLSALFRAFGSKRPVATAVWLLRGGPRGQYTASGVIQRFACALGLCWGQILGGHGPLLLTSKIIIAFQTPFVVCCSLLKIVGVRFPGVLLRQLPWTVVIALSWTNMRLCILACLALYKERMRPSVGSGVPLMESDIAWAAPVSDFLYRTSTWTWLIGAWDRGRPRRATVSAMVALNVLHSADFLLSVPRFFFFDVDFPYLRFYIHARMWTLLFLLMYALTRNFLGDKDDYLRLSPDEEDRRAWRRFTRTIDPVLAAAMRIWAWSAATFAAIAAATTRRPPGPPPRPRQPATAAGDGGGRRENAPRADDDAQSADEAKSGAAAAAAAPRKTAARRERAARETAAAEAAAAAAAAQDAARAREQARLDKAAEHKRVSRAAKKAAAEAAAAAAAVTKEQEAAAALAGKAAARAAVTARAVAVRGGAPTATPPPISRAAPAPPAMQPPSSSADASDDLLPPWLRVRLSAESESGAGAAAAPPLPAPRHPSPSRLDEPIAPATADSPPPAQSDERDPAFPPSPGVSVDALCVVCIEAPPNHVFLPWCARTLAVRGV